MNDQGGVSAWSCLIQGTKAYILIWDREPKRVYQKYQNTYGKVPKNP